MQTAIELHDCEFRRSEKWNYLINALIGLFSAVIGAAGTLIAVYLGSQLK